MMEQEKLYSPVNFFLRDKTSSLEGQYDDVHYWRDDLSHSDAFGYMREIKSALADERRYYDNGRGLAEYLDAPLLDKVRSLFPDIELHGDQLWTVAHIELNEPLAPAEIAELKDWWEGQLSDGWGEGFEQREIKVDRGDLYVEPWERSDDFFIATQAEFDRRMGIEHSAPNIGEPRIDSTLDQQLAQIAKKHCRIETLEERNRDSLDFHEVSVWGLKAALQEAFEAGAAHQASHSLVQHPARVDKPLSFEEFVDKCRMMDEACRQWCAHIDDAPERRNGLLFTEFYTQICQDKYQEYLDDPAYRDDCHHFAGMTVQERNAFTRNAVQNATALSAAPASGRPSLLAELREAKAKSGQQKSIPTTNKSEPEL